ncbi:MAG TPA: hypothetical protein VJ547_08340 [Candidatus Thermoplasmatota archaeon]|nr:hypothetical protein [Candidatus Thermoplasmatota archaeon]
MTVLVRSAYLDTNVYIAAYQRGPLRAPTGTFIGLLRARALAVAGSAALRNEFGAAPVERRSRGSVALYLELVNLELPRTREAAALKALYTKVCGLKGPDAEHLAFAVLSGVDAFVSWNRKDILRPSTVGHLARANDLRGLRTPLILDPAEFVRRAKLTPRRGRLVLD